MMKTAREMFEELGYEQTENNLIYLVYENNFSPTITIRFYKEVGGCLVDSNDLPVLMTLEEYKVIVKQLEELGWLDVD